MSRNITRPWGSKRANPKKFEYQERASNRLVSLLENNSKRAKNNISSKELVKKLWKKTDDLYHEQSYYEANLKLARMKVKSEPNRKNYWSNEILKSKNRIHDVNLKIGVIKNKRAEARNEMLFTRMEEIKFLINRVKSNLYP